jgi:hypothetical protein
MSKTWLVSVLLGAALSAPAVICGQEAPPPGPPPHEGMMPGGPLGPRMEILGFEEMHPGKVVSGAPYSATTLIETTQTLSDGTNITRKIQANVYRDSQGRVRRDTTLPAIGPLATNGQTKSFVLIHDPVAGTAYELRPDRKTAVQLPARNGNKNPDALQNKMEARIEEEIANGTLKKEDLGTQSINGIQAQGTRYTRTIPAGQIGNDKAITVVNERWYSPDLQIVVKSTRTDPRFGTSTYTVTNVQRQEPAASLFTVPSDYTITQGRGPRGHHGGGPGTPPPDAAPPSE